VHVVHEPGRRANRDQDSRPEPTGRKQPSGDFVCHALALIGYRSCYYVHHHHFFFLATVSQRKFSAQTSSATAVRGKPERPLLKRQTLSGDHERGLRY